MHSDRERIIMDSRGITPLPQSVYLPPSEPMGTALQGMNMQYAMLEMHSENIAKADLPGYQKKIPVINSFAEYLGMQGLDTVLSTKVGRILNTQKPLDIALGTEGFFQKRLPDGEVQLTRDGRFQLSTDGQLLALDKSPILSASGQAIRFHKMPEDISLIKVDMDGTVSILDPVTKEPQKVDKLGIITISKKPVSKPDVKQGFVEFSNVLYFDEYSALVPVRRAFQANKQMFSNQSQLISRLIQELGRRS